MSRPPPTQADDDASDAGDAPLEGHLRASRELLDAPASAVERAIGVWKPRRPAAPDSARRQVDAVRLDDPLPAGAQPQLRCRGDGVEVSLQAVAMGRVDRWRVSGQVIGRSVASVVLRCGALAVAVMPDALGAFVVDEVPSDVCRIVLVTGDSEVVLPDWTLAATA